MALRQLLVRIDGDARTMTTSLPNAGEVLANLEASNRYLPCHHAARRLVFNRSLDAWSFRSTASTAKAVFATW